MPDEKTAIAASNGETVNVTVDGKKVTVPKGSLVISAAFAAGADVPYFCHHPRLTPAGACRMCLVLLNKVPRPVTACTYTCTEGMDIDTRSPVVMQAQQAMLEFLLINHPLDCPICDRGGECPLQNMTFQYGPGATRFVDEKRHFPKPIPISEHVLLDRERCIQCARCTRFTQEISGDGELSIQSRGNSAIISAFSGGGLNSKFSGNTIELCPVGALLSKSYRFTARPWEFRSHDSICTMCGVGCNIVVQTRNNALLRVNARENEAVNEEWTCDTGKFGQYWTTSQERVTAPMVLRAGRMMPTTWDEAMNDVVAAFKSAAGDDGSAVAGIAGTHVSNEDAYLFQKLFRIGFGSNNIDHRIAPFPIHRMQTSIAEIGAAKRIVAVGFEPKEYLPVIWLWIYKAISKNGATYDRVDTVSDAKVADAIKAGEGSIILTSAAISEADAKSIMDKAKKTGAKVDILLPDNNSWGLIDMGVLPDRFPAQQMVANGARPKFETLWGGPAPANPGLNTAGIIDGAASGKIKALYIMGSDPIALMPDAEATAAAIEKVPFVVVQDMFMTETAKRASVFLPSCSFIERDGRFTNIEGRVQEYRKAIEPLGQSKPDWRILAELLARLGKPVAYFDTKDIASEIALALA
jgi:NADH-quinone oxidoreductase subunit G